MTWILDWFNQMWSGVWRIFSDSFNTIIEAISQGIFGYGKDDALKPTEAGDMFTPTTGKPTQGDLIPPLGSPIEQLPFDMNRDVKAFAAAASESMKKAEDYRYMLLPGFGEVVDSLKSKFGILGHVLALPLLIPCLIAKFKVPMEMAGQALGRQWAQSNPMEPPDMQTLLAMAVRYPEYEHECNWLARMHGVDLPTWRMLREGVRKVFTEEQIYQVHKRAEYDDPTQQAASIDFLNRELNRLGWNPEDIPHLRKLFEHWPGADDLIRYAVRECYKPEQEWQDMLMTNYPESLEKDGAVVGLSPYWAKMAWKGHWVLPSITLAMEALHRGKLSSEDFKDLLIYHDLMPKYLEPIYAVSFKPLTRVDVRRMFAVGVIKTKEELISRYKDLGYDDTNAAYMADFTLAVESGIDRKKIMREIVSAYEKNLRDREWAVLQLAALQYDQDTIDKLLEWAQIDRDKRILDAAIRSIKARLRNDQINNLQAQMELGTLGLAPDQIDDYIAQWADEEANKVSQPTPKDLAQMVAANVISGVEYLAQLRSRGYSDQHIKGYATIYGIYDEYLAGLI